MTNVQNQSIFKLKEILVRKISHNNKKKKTKKPHYKKLKVQKKKKQKKTTRKTRPKIKGKEIRLTAQTLKSIKDSLGRTFRDR